jgi:hypothetical protein
MGKRMMISTKPSVIAMEIGVTLPKGYQIVKDLNLANLDPWHLMSDKEFDLLFPGINERYPTRSVIPFATRGDNDDVACFVSRDPEQETGQVILIHDFASPGYEVIARMKSFWSWFKYAIDEMIESYEAET